MIAAVAAAGNPHPFASGRGEPPNHDRCEASGGTQDDSGAAIVRDVLAAMAGTTDA